MKKIIHKNPWFSLLRYDIKRDKNNQVYFFLNKKPTAFIIAETEEQRIIFIEEYRVPINKTIWQLPAGMIDTNNSLKSAKKELLEETGIEAGKWKKLGEFFVAPGHENTKIIVYVAKKIEKYNETAIKEINIKNVESFSKPEIISMIRENKILCGITLASLNLYFSKDKNSPI